MAEFIVSWSPYGPSGRIEAMDQEDAIRFTQSRLRGLGLETDVYVGEPESDDIVRRHEGAFIVIRSPLKRYGDMASFGVCVYAVGQTSYYDRQRERLAEQFPKEVERLQGLADGNPLGDDVSMTL